MDSPKPLPSHAQLRHDLANPLSAILAEAQLMLLEHPDLDPEVRRAVQTIEQMALRMRSILREGSA
ncbi:MAG: hypothetical protein KJZ47_10675 [Gemmatimonadales bacterium]|nr:hypothetical protein [Gemmatimonadales bacterium]